MTGSDSVDAGVATGTAATDGPVAARQEAPDVLQVRVRGPMTGRRGGTPGRRCQQCLSCWTATLMIAQDFLV
jgi:hypothetical protein